MITIKRRLFIACSRESGSGVSMSGERRPREDERRGREERSDAGVNDRNPYKRSPGSVGGSGICYQCRRPGHFARECPQSRQLVDGQPVMMMSPPPRTCHRCAQPGHFLKDCPEKEKICYQCHRPGHISIDCGRQ
jgi:cellular nucleic acid-binding protein